MLVVIMNTLQFEYDVHSLVKAFYPEMEIKMLTSLEFETWIHKSEIEFPIMKLEFGESQISFRVNEEEEEKTIFFQEGIERSQMKNHLKQLIYDVLSKFLNKELPWGTLTGIRPTKIPMHLLEEQWEEKNILEYMLKTYHLSEEKALLCIDIAKREKELLCDIHYKEGYSLYIGIPFCPTTCLYCSFTSYPIHAYAKCVDDYLEAMEREIEFVAKAYQDKILDSIYIGGGTPTTLEANQMERLLCKIESSFDCTSVKEFTVEAGRADSITLEKLEVIKKHKVTRISVNPQTMKEETLKMIGRNHTVKEAIETYHMAREAGFDNINMDIILGLPGETKEDVAYTIEEIKKLKPDSLTVHSLAIKRASKMQEWIEKNGVETLKNTSETMEIAANGATDMGMKPYYLYRQKNMSGNFENVGYATEGKYGIYNILIMEELQTIVALGAGSISKVVFEDGRIERADNVKDVTMYIEKIDEMIERKRKLFAIK